MINESAELESRRLRYFLSVAKHLHFGRAADELHIAQSGLSKQIADLESRLQVRLLNRDRRSVVSLTAAGAALYRDALIGVTALERAATSARQAARGQTGNLSIGYVASATFSGALPQVMQAFRARHPGVTLDVKPMETPAQLSALRDGLIDVGFLRPPKTYPAGITGRVIHRETMLVALHLKHSLAKTRLEFRHLAEETFIVPQFDENSVFAEHLARMASGGGFQPRNILNVPDFLTALTLASAGYGIVPVPKCMLAISIRNVIFKPVAGYSGSVDLAVAYLARATSPAVTAFLASTSRA